MGWGKYPRRCISRVTHLTFTMSTCNDVHKLEDFFFSGLIKEVYQEENWVMMTWTFYLPAKMPMKNDKKVPHCISNLFKKIQQTLLLIVSCIKCLPGLNGYSPKTGSKYSLAKTVWKMNHLSELVTFLFHTWRETQKKKQKYLFSLPISP